MATAKKTAKKKVSSTARKRSSKPRRRSTPSTAAAAPAQRWYEHPLASPVIWTVIAGALTLIWTYGEGLYDDYADQFIRAPQPFAGDRVGILLARLQDDPGNEFVSQVRNALERQFPITADGSSSVDVTLYPQRLELPEHGNVRQHIVEANAEGLQWLEDQNADLLIWGRAFPETERLELRIVTRGGKDKSSAGEIYEITIPSKFSEQISGALAGMVVGAGANAWNQRGDYLAPARAQELYDWLPRLKTLRDEIPDSLDKETRAEIRENIDAARLQIGAALLAEGDDPRAMQIINDLFSSDIWKAHPFLFAEILADLISLIALQVNQIGEDQASEFTATINELSEGFDKLHAEGVFTDGEYAYLSGIMHKLAGQIQVLSGKSDESMSSFAKAADQLEVVLADLSKTDNQLSSARVQRYLGELQLMRAVQSDADEAKPLLEASVESFSQALETTPSDTAPRDSARLRQLLSTAEFHRAVWFIDAKALESAIDNQENFRSLLLANHRTVKAVTAATELTSLLISDALFTSGVPSAEKSLALLDELEPQGNEIEVKQQTAAIDLGRCQAHFAAALRLDADGESLSAPAQEHLALSRKACTAAEARMVELDNATGWAEAKWAIANGLSVSGAHTKDEDQLREALKTAQEVEEMFAEINVPAAKVRAAQETAAAMRALGVLTNDAALMQEAIDRQQARRSLVGKEFAVQRIEADVELGRSLTALAELQGTRDGLDEAIELLSNARDRYAAGGAKLAADDAERELKKAEALQAKLALN